MQLFSLYKWENLVADSPHPQTRNEWLFKYGAFGRLNGLWFPCRISNFSTIGEPATVIPVPIASFNRSIYPSKSVPAADMDVLYTVFANGTSLEAYCYSALYRKNITTKMLDGALARSLNTEIITAPKRLITQIKRAINAVRKNEIRVVDTTIKDSVQIIEIPRTAEILEKLWNSNDYALQELSQVLGISYNPQPHKKSRMITGELLGDRDITIMNREMITSRLQTAAAAFGEKVTHISTFIDTLDRHLSYDGENLYQNRNENLNKIDGEGENE